MANPKFACSYGEFQEMKSKVQEVSDENSALRKENSELRDQIARLTAQLSEGGAQKKTFRDSLGCDAEINELFGFTATADGRLIRDVSAQKPFAAFQNIVMKALKPTAYTYTKKGEKTAMVRGANISELSEKERPVAEETFRKVIKALAEGKKKMGGAKK